MIYLNKNDYTFPDIQKFSKKDFFEDGIVAVGGDLHHERLLNAYKKGIFPWYNEDDPILWWCPDVRAVLYVDDFHISKNLKKTINKQIFEIKYNHNFISVIKNCKSISRKTKGTWINNDMQQAYIKLFELGYAHSVEAYFQGELVGGLYGVLVNNVFCGESMFAKKNDASKVAFYYLVKKLKKDNIKLIDCQIQNNHLRSLGVKEISRGSFFSILDK